MVKRQRDINLSTILNCLIDLCDDYLVVSIALQSVIGGANEIDHKKYVNKTKTQCEHDIKLIIG